MRRYNIIGVTFSRFKVKGQLVDDLFHLVSFQVTPKKNSEEFAVQSSIFRDCVSSLQPASI